MTIPRSKLATVLLVCVIAAMSACGGKEEPAPGGKTAATASDADDPLPPSTIESQLPPQVLENILKPVTGDLDELVKRRTVRVGTTFNRTFYFVDKGVQRGVVYDYGRLVEDRLNKHFKTGLDDKVHVVFVPLPRDMLLPALVEGKVDLVAAQVTVTPELRKHVDFTAPTRTNVSEIVVTGPDTPAMASVDDLSGKEVFVRENSNYHQSLLALNEKFTARGKPPVMVETAPANLEDDDLLEMVNAGLIPAIVVDDYLAAFWKRVLPNLRVHDKVAIRSGSSLAIAIRKNSPQLTRALNTFMDKYGLGSSFGNQIERRYLINTTYASDATSQEGRRKFQAVIDLFRKYGTQYDLDFLLMAAQGYQESRLDQNAKSQVGAIGIMQVMPATGKELNVGDIKKVEANIHAGVKYMRTTMDTFFNDDAIDPLNRGLLTFAAYNAGPGRVRQLRREAEKQGLNPNVWFGNVEQIASERIGRETVTYVANIYKYYVAYRLVMEESERRAAAKATMKGKN